MKSQAKCATMDNMQEVQLFPCTANGIATLLQIARNPEAAEFFRHFPPMYEWSNDQSFLQTLLLQSLEVVYNGSRVGLVTFSQTNPAARSMHVSIVVDHCDHKVITDQAYAQIIDYVFKQKDFKRLEVKVLPHRTKLIKRLEAIGFKVEGTLKNSARFNGELCNEVLLARTE